MTPPCTHRAVPWPARRSPRTICGEAARLWTVGEKGHWSLKFQTGPIGSIGVGDAAYSTIPNLYI